VQPPGKANHLFWEDSERGIKMAKKIDKSKVLWHFTLSLIPSHFPLSRISPKKGLWEAWPRRRPKHLFGRDSGNASLWL